MEDQKPDGFKIDFSDDIPEPSGKSSSPLSKGKPRKKSASKTRPAVAFILLFCMFAGLLFLVYYHLNNRIAQVESARQQRADSIAESVSDNIEKRFSAISEIISEPTKQMKARILALEKQVKEQKSNAGVLENEVAETKAGVKTSLSGLEKNLQNRIAQQENKINALESKLESSEDENIEKIKTIEKQVANLQQLSSRIEKTEKRTEGLKNQLRSVEQKTDNLKPDIENIATIKNIEEKTSEIEARLVKQIKENTSQLHKQILSLEDQISSLEAIIRSLQHMQSSGAKEESEKDKPGNSGASGTGQIIEQEIQ